MEEGVLRVLLIGSGGREHALAWKLSQSPRLGRLYAAPGNPGIARHAELVDLDTSRHHDDAAWATAHAIDLVVVGPEDPLIAGIADVLSAAGLAVFGPSKAAAAIEGSKSWSKALMRRHGIPCAAGESFTDVSAARDWLRAHPGPAVVKADGPAVGKGVIVADSTDEAEAAVAAMLVEGRFGAAGARVVLEERLTGREVSAFALIAGDTVVPLGLATDYKRVGDGDVGPNTGGMGGYSPVPFADATLTRFANETVLAGAARALVAEGRPFCGFLYAGLMLTPGGPRVIEFNCRFGDPEAQLLMPRIDADLLPLMFDAATGRLRPTTVALRDEVTVEVVLASGGYPGDYVRGVPIEGIDEAEALPGALVFFAGTRQGAAGVETNGGRVLCAVGRGRDIAGARRVAYDAAERIRFEGRQFRRDIAAGV